MFLSQLSFYWLEVKLTDTEINIEDVKTPANQMGLIFCTIVC